MVDTKANDAAPRLSMQSLPISGHTWTMAMSVQAVLLYEVVGIFPSFQKGEWVGAPIQGKGIFRTQVVAYNSQESRHDMGINSVFGSLLQNMIVAEEAYATVYKATWQVTAVAAV
jgi:hypothetical protein